MHRFWFGEHDDWGKCARRNYARWFERGRELDEPVRERFSQLVQAAGQGRLDHWQDTPAGALALVLTLDQFPRHLHRGSAGAFALDGAARRVCEAGLEAGLARELSPVEQSFFVLPLEHAEDLAAQERCVALARALAESCAAGDGDVAWFLGECARYAAMHRDVIARFGRFPHRNEALGRPSTAEELAYLRRGAARFGQ